MASRQPRAANAQPTVSQSGARCHESESSAADATREKATCEPTRPRGSRSSRLSVVPASSDDAATRSSAYAKAGAQLAQLAGAPSSPPPPPSREAKAL